MAPWPTQPNRRNQPKPNPQQPKSTHGWKGCNGSKEHHSRNSPAPGESCAGHSRRRRLVPAPGPTICTHRSLESHHFTYLFRRVSGPQGFSEIECIGGVCGHRHIKIFHQPAGAVVQNVDQIEVASWQVPLATVWTAGANVPLEAGSSHTHCVELTQIGVKQERRIVAREDNVTKAFTVGEMFLVYSFPVSVT